MGGYLQRFEAHPATTSQASHARLNAKIDASAQAPNGASDVHCRAKGLLDVDELHPTSAISALLNFAK